VLSEFSERLGNTYANDQLLPRMAAALAGGTGAIRADVWVRIGDQLVSEATWPHDAEALRPIVADDDDPGDLSPTQMREPIRHQGELLGALSIVKRPGDSISPPEEKLVRDLAGQAGLVMRNVALTEQLMDNVDNSAPRSNGWSARTRNGASSVQPPRRRAATARRAVGAAPLGGRPRRPGSAKTKTMLANLQTATGQAIEDLRDLAHGIYPHSSPTRGWSRRSKHRPARDPSAPRWRRAASIFTRSRSGGGLLRAQALSNVAKYAGVGRAAVGLAQSKSDLTFGIGRWSGFDMDRTSYGTGLRGMADRVGAISRSSSAPGRGTSVSADRPLQ
jgi:hypothetical protein